MKEFKKIPLFLKKRDAFITFLFSSIIRCITDKEVEQKDITTKTFQSVVVPKSN